MTNTLGDTVMYCAQCVADIAVYMRICNDMLCVLICTGSDGSPARQRDAGLDERQDITGVSCEYNYISV
jgi:hypothetical protein